MVYFQQGVGNIFQKFWSILALKRYAVAADWAAHLSYDFPTECTELIEMFPSVSTVNSTKGHVFILLFLILGCLSAEIRINA